jgi:hypothetical protein
MGVQVSFTPGQLNFGPVRPGSSGPDISVDPSFGPPGISFNGSVQVTSAPVDAVVTARVDRDRLHFTVRDITVLEWRLEPVPPEELPPGHKGPPPKVKVLEIADQGDGSSPITVKAGQFLLVRVEYHAHNFGSSFKDTLIIESNTWNTIEVPLSLFLAEVTTEFPVQPLVIARGQTMDFPIKVTLLVGPPTDVSYEMSRTQLHTGISIVGTKPSPIHVNGGDKLSGAIQFRADPDAPLGSNTLAIDQLAFGRHGMLLPVDITHQPTTTGFDSSIVWEQANPLGINLDAEADGWNAGRVLDVISLTGGALLVGTSAGGVWTVTTAGTAIPHSNDWDNPNIVCLARGLDDPNHFFAGCAAGGTLYESEPDTAFFGFLAWHAVPLVDAKGTPLGVGTVYRIAVINHNRKLVLACQNGVFWADLPGGGGVSAFKKATSVPNVAFSGATQGPQGSVVVGAWGDGNKQFGIFIGNWSSGDLAFQKMNVPGDSAMFWTTLASCDGNLNRMYAAASDKNGKLISILRHDHTNNNMNWEVCNKEVVSAPSGKDVLNSSGDSTFGGWIKTLRVSPTNPDVVALNWARSFFSNSGGRNPWIAVDQIPGGPDAKDWDRSKEWRQHMHEDGHATVFDVDNEQTLYIATDGGVGMTPDMGKTYFSKFNQKLATLMFASQPAREGSGTFTIGPQPTGLIAGGLQDNGDVYCQLTPSVSPWQRLDGGDGIGMQFLPVGRRLIWFVNDDIGVKVSRWDGSKFVDTAVIPRADEFPLQDGLKNPVMEAIERPLFRDPATAQLMVAVGCGKGTGSIFGLFADVDGGNMKWQVIGFLPPLAQGDVTAIGSLHGDIIWIATADGRIFSMGARRPPDGGFSIPFEFVTPRSSNPGQVDRFLIMSDALAYAAYNTSSGQGLILQLNFFSWDPLGANSNVAKGVGLPMNEGAYYGLATDRDALPHTLFAATDNHVYVSRDDGDTWKLATFGLPRRPHCTELRVDSADSKNKFVYLSTYGRSLWRAKIN